MTFIATYWNNDITTYIPQVSSPLRTSGEVVGSKDIATSSAGIACWEKRLLVTVGMGRPPGVEKAKKLVH